MQQVLRERSLLRTRSSQRSATNLTTATAVAESNPAPTSLAGLTVVVEDSAGVARNAPLFFVSPGQFNFLVPQGTAPGPATISVTGGASAVSGGCPDQRGFTRAIWGGGLGGGERRHVPRWRAERREHASNWRQEEISSWLRSISVRRISRCFSYFMGQAYAITPAPLLQRSDR